MSQSRALQPNPLYAYIALGSNLGDREKNLHNAVTLIDATGRLRVTRMSRWLDNPAVGGPPDSGPFLNGVIEAETALSAADLLHRLLHIERKMGRIRREKWGPRLIDLDLLMLGSQTIQSPDLTIPHPRMHERRFVLEPMAQIAPHVIVPGIGKTISQLLVEFT